MLVNAWADKHHIAWLTASLKSRVWLSFFPIVYDQGSRAKRAAAINRVGINRVIDCISHHSTLLFDSLEIVGATGIIITCNTRCGTRLQDKIRGEDHPQIQRVSPQVVERAPSASACVLQSVPLFLLSSELRFSSQKCFSNAAPPPLLPVVFCRSRTIMLRSSATMLRRRSHPPAITDTVDTKGCYDKPGTQGS